MHSGYLSGGCSCQETVPASVAMAAWKRELAGARALEGRFFSFSWRGGEWLAYGQPDGHVRGIYCPPHSAQRAAHSSASERVAAFA